MYNKYFGFREKPFNVTPDPRFLFENVSYQEAYANLFYGIRERKGFIVLTGEAGTGKTTLLRRIMDSFEDALRFVFFYNTTLSFEELLDHIFTELHLDPQSVDGRLKKIQTLNHFLIAQLEQGGTVALLIDEAQNLSDETLENLRLLSNLETAQEKLLQIVLVGQPELETKLSQPHLRQLKQRIVTWSKLNHLRDDEIGPFVVHRLQRAGYDGPPLFTEEAIQRITLYSKGIPRLVNVICDNALLLAYAASRRAVSAPLIEEAAHDLQLLSGSRKIRITTLLGNGTQLAEPSSHLQEQARPHPQTPTRRAEEPSLLPNPVQATIAQKNGATPWVLHSPSLTQGIRLGISLLLLLTTGVAAFGLMFSSNANVFPESKVTGLTDRVVSLAQTLNGAFSSFFIKTLGLEAQKGFSIPQPIVARQENPQDRTEAPGPDSVRPLAEKTELEGMAPLEKAPESDSNNIPEATVLSPAVDTEPHEQASGLVVEAKNSSETPGQQNFASLTPSVTTPQNLLEVQEQKIRLQPGATILNLVRQIYGSQNTLALVLIKEFNPHINDLDYVTAGTTILAPSLTEETLLRKQPDGSYRLLLAVFPRAALAQKHAALARRHGYSVEVSPAKVAGSLLLHQVEIVGLPSREAGQRAWTFVDLHNVLTVVSQTSENGKPTE
jgi:general secretion pathway protein A